MPYMSIRHQRRYTMIQQPQVTVSIRLPKPTVNRIKKIAKTGGSTLSQFVRTATINALKQRTEA